MLVFIVNRTMSSSLLGGFGFQLHVDVVVLSYFCIYVFILSVGYLIILISLVEYYDLCKLHLLS